MKVPKFFLIKGVQLLFRGGGWGRGQKSSANQILLGFSLDAPWMLLGCSLDSPWILHVKFPMKANSNCAI